MNGYDWNRVAVVKAATLLAWSPLRVGTGFTALLVAGLAVADPSPLAAQESTVSGVPAALASWTNPIEDFGARLGADVARDTVGGIVAGVMFQGDLVWARAWGWSDRDARARMSTAAVSRTGSISKTVTAFLMMHLVDEGVLDLDDPVRDYLPEVQGFTDARPGTAPITFRQLASHTAGLIREPNWPGSVVGPIELWEERILESIPQTAFDSIPGARYQYSNIGFGTLGLALARAAGRPFMEMVEDEIFTPLGMTGSAFVVAGAELESRLAAGYSFDDGRIDGEQPAREHLGRGYKVPNGGVYSTVADLGRFLGALSGVPGLRVLSEESRTEMITIQTPEDPSSGYGLGVRISIDEAGNRIISHGGTVAGYNAHMAADPGPRRSA